MLVGKNITLRLFTEEDLDEFLSFENTFSEFGEHSRVDFRSPVKFRKQFIETGGWEENLGRMLITNQAEKMLGHIVFYKEPPMMSGLEVGFGIFRRADRGKGYTSEALRIFSAYLFELKPIPRLQLHTSQGNIASRRVAEKCGYQLEGVFRNYFYARGEYQDCVQYSLLRDECPLLSKVLDG